MKRQILFLRHENASGGPQYVRRVPHHNLRKSVARQILPARVRISFVLSLGCCHAAIEYFFGIEFRAGKGISLVVHRLSSAKACLKDYDDAGRQRGCDPVSRQVRLTKWTLPHRPNQLAYLSASTQGG